MKGKILGVGFISGDDGNRYKFAREDIKNLENKSDEQLVNCTVDFEAQGNEAKDIFITAGGGIDFSNFSKSLSDSSVESIKTKIFISFGLYFVGGIISLIPFVGWVLAPIAFIVAFVLTLMSFSAASKASNLPILKNYLISIGMSIFGAIIAIASSFSLVTSLFFGSMHFGAVSGGSIAGLIIGYLIMLGALYFIWLYYKYLSLASGEKLFVYTFIARIVTMVLIWVPILDILLLIATLVMEIMAWVRTKTLNAHSTSNSQQAS